MMLSSAVREQAREAIEARFRLRDEALEKELQALATRMSRDVTGEERDRLGIRLRLICERDLFERAQVAWASLQRAHRELEKVRRGHLQRALLDELDAQMRVAALNLAGRLRSHASDLAAAFSGRQAIDAEWIARLRERAYEQQAQRVEEYVSSLRRGVPLPRR